MFSSRRYYQASLGLRTSIERKKTKYQVRHCLVLERRLQLVCVEYELCLRYAQRIHYLRYRTKLEFYAPTIAGVKYTSLECRASNCSTCFRIALEQTLFHHLRLLLWRFQRVERHGHTIGQLRKAQ